MDLKHLQALMGIADTGSFSAAAASIGTVQSNVSAHVARLEKELEVQLVDRASGRLTEEGEVVIERARRIMNELEAMLADVTAMREEVVGTVHLGMIGTTGRWLVPQLFDLLRVRHPHIHLNVADGASVQLEQLSGLELLLPAPGTALRAEIDSVIVPTRITLSPAMELDGVRLLASLAFDGYGPAILPATAVPGHLRGRFPVLPVDGLPRRRVGVAQRRRGLPSAPVRAVIDVLGLVVNDALSMPDGIHPT